MAAILTLQLDLRTLLFVDASLTVLLGLLLLLTWLQSRSFISFAWWGGAHLNLALAIFLLGYGNRIDSSELVGIGVSLIVLTYALIWTAARRFDGRKLLIIPVLAGPLAWLAIRFSGLVVSADILFSFGCILLAGYCFAAAYELWRGRAENLLSRWWAIGLLALTGAGFLTWIPLNVVMPFTSGAVLPGQWFDSVILVTILGKVALAFSVVGMAKERLELRERTQALTDPLTGMPNRRAFFRASARLLRDRSRQREPVSAVLFDLDHFKKINDRHGHAVGDRMLRIFAAVLFDRLQASDIVGRVGGEEFAALLPAKLSDAVRAAERVREAYRRAVATIDGGIKVDGTVSAGVASAEAEICDLHRLLARADAALYAAKSKGRNRVEIADDEAEPDAAAAGTKGSGAESPELVPELERAFEASGVRAAGGKG